MWSRALAGVAIAVAAWGWSSVASASPTTLYLNFSDGTENIEDDQTDDASRNRSKFCNAAPYASWTGAEDCGPRAACKAEIVARVEEHWREFDVVVTAERPTDRDYVMVVIGPPSGTCRFGLQGIADIDCRNAIVGNVAFAFDCDGPASVCAGVISHELGHGFGLVHSPDPADLMYGSVLPGDSQAFRDEYLPVSDAVCGRQIQNPHERLAEFPGMWPATRQRVPEASIGTGVTGSDLGGCQLGGERGIGDGYVWCALAALATLLGRRSAGAVDERRRRQRATSPSHVRPSEAICPRFARRWIGSSPTIARVAKDETAKT